MTPDGQPPTEEDLRCKTLVPHLAALGFTLEQVSFERPFSIRLGRHEHRVPAVWARGRCDCLVKSLSGRPLFVFELKRPGEAITDEDVAQAWSYANAHWPRAPFAIVSNGTDTRIIDTLTRERIEGSVLPERWRSWSAGTAHLSMDELSARQEALTSFISMSATNLQAFSKAQVRDAMAPLTTAASGRRPAYHKPLNVARAAITTSIQEFMSGSHSAFVLTGGSGLGKTTAMCMAAEQLAEDRMVLVYLGISLHKPIGEAIADTFLWNFSATTSLPQIFDRLARLSRQVNRPTVIVLDGVDEIISPDVPQQLHDMAAHVGDYGGDIRLLVSMTTAEWPRFAKLGGTRSSLAIHMKPSPVAPSSAADDEEPERASLELSPFDPREHDDALRAYRDEYRLTLPFSSEVQTLTRDPLWLRVVAEVLAVDPSLDISATGRALLTAYIDTRLGKLRGREERRAAQTALERAAVVMRDASTERLSPSSVPVRDVVGNDNGSSLSHGLELATTVGLLKVSRDDARREWVGFQYERLCDFVVAYHVFKLDCMTPAAWASQLDTLLKSPLARGPCSYISPMRPMRRFSTSCQPAAEPWLCASSSTTNESGPDCLQASARESRLIPLSVLA